MRVGIIGLGDIAKKAYLPVMTDREDIELVLCTRNVHTLNHLQAKYRIAETMGSVEQLIASGIQAAFIHTSTETHAQIAEQLINNGIHVFIDKPISYYYTECERIAKLAEQKQVLLMVGFNRRFAPMIASLKNHTAPRMIMLQKNRISLPDMARRFIFDDFIHVVDTLRFLAPSEVKQIKVSPYIHEGKLYHITLQLEGDGFTCIGVMNRDSGANEEILEVMNPGNKWLIEGLNTTIHWTGGEEKHVKFKDWDPVLYRRGFSDMTDHFLSCVREGKLPSITITDALESHHICELIVQEVEKLGALTWESR
ncbi:Gfo/Idh/MocA family oxidoreductase [Paenibacillus sp. D2_2]|uniref:Gfo/Idh/MocA family protein n=1 Tax=Paenibacillus sp. D2_2 TaxID=3073092 RepID=UPI0028165A25|nr:Gfo/Idh/MocA family oxidoreductase [Paenibacillus sp. D2_2]WMT38962.1 Gfo/Idh/MocA family oxidoreductase [Paenibacillus sp. D2_2]